MNQHVVPKQSARLQRWIRTRRRRVGINNPRERILARINAFSRRRRDWRVWSEASGKIKIEGRYIARRKTVVTIGKGDGTDVSVPIHQLAGPLRRLPAKTPITAEINKVDGVVSVRVSDELEVEYMMVGRKLLAVAMAGSYGKPESVLVDAATVPHREAINLMKKVDTSKLKMLERGSKILVDTSSDA